MFKQKVISALRMVFPILLLGLFTIPVFAQQEKGDKELQLQGLIQVQFGDSKAAAGDLFINFGYFFTDRQEAGIGTNVGISGSSDNVDFQAGLTAFYRYHFARKKGNLQPYVGVDFFAFDLTSAARTDLIYVRPNIGVKYFFKKNAAFDINSGYGFAVKDAGNGIADTRLGLSYIF